MTSLPSRLPGIGPALLSIAAQERRPDRLILSLPRNSAREGREYALPPELRTLLSQHPWVEVQWLDEDFGPGTKLLGALRWLGAEGGRRLRWQEGDLLMVLDDDHAYLHHALAELSREQLARGARYAVSFFAYFFRGIMVPQGADIIAFQLSEGFVEDMLEYHRTFVKGDPACFLVDDLWIGLYLRLCDTTVVSLRDLVVKRGLQTVYARTENAKVVALEALGGEDRRDRVTLRAFDGLLARLSAAGPAGLQRWGGADAARRVQQLTAEVRAVERQISEIQRWLEREQPDHEAEAGAGVQKAREQLTKLRHLYQMQVPTQPARR